MEYHRNINIGLNVINEILRDIGQSELGENINFKLWEDFHHSDFLRYDSIRKNRVPLSFWIEKNGIRLDIDSTPEVWEFPLGHVMNNSLDVKNIITMVLTSKIKIKKVGKNCKYIYMIDKNGSLLGTVKRISSLFFWCLGKTSVKTYPPYWRVSSSE